MSGTDYSECEFHSQNVTVPGEFGANPDIQSFFTQLSYITD